MKTHKTRDVVLALTGLAALALYILACTSFSPDDKKVLYPAFDAASGRIGLAVYDRETKRSDMVLVPAAYDLSETNASHEPALVRGQWLADVRSILVAYAASDKDSDKAINVALAPWGTRGTTRLFEIAGLENGGTTFLMPLCLSGERLFLRVSPHAVARLDLASGEVVRHEFAQSNKEVVLYPAPDGDRLFCIEQEERSQEAALKLLNPDDFSRASLLTIPDLGNDDRVFAFNSQGTLGAFMIAAEGTNRLMVIRKGQPDFMRTFDTKGTKWAFGNACLSPKGDTLWVAYQKKASQTANTASYGLLEVPFSQAPLREITLIETAKAEDSADPQLFEASISHDGKTAAVASTYLAAGDKGLNPADCALFLVDLSSAERKVAKVTIPMPQKR